MYELSDLPHRGKIEDFKGEKTYSGTVTEDTKKRMLCALDLLVQRAKPQQIFSQKTELWWPFKYNFITLTVTNSGRIIDAKEGNKILLEPWLRYMRNKCGLKDYVWKAEMQTNGQLHYHIASSTYLPQNFVRWKWNKTCKEAELLNTFARTYGHFNPPSTEVTHIRNVRDAKAYISKEFAKKNQNTISLKGKIWDCNDTLKRGYYSGEMDSNSFFKIQGGIEAKQIIKKIAEKCTIFITPTPLQFLSETLKQNAFNHIYS